MVRIMNQNFEQKLAHMAQQLHSGEVKELTFLQRKIDTGDKQIVIAHLIHEPTLTEKFEREVADIGKDKVIQLPFVAHKEGDCKTVISGVIDQENMKRAKKGGKKFQVIRNFVAKKIEEWKKEVERLGEKEDDLDHIYRDDEGRYYEIIDGIPTYLDDRGFDYYLKYDENGNEYAWIKLTDGSIGTFLNPERTYIQVGDHAYYFDGTIRYDKEIDLFPHR